MTNDATLKIGFLPANRGFFDANLAKEMRAETIAALETAGMTVIVPDESQTKQGCVESIAEAEVCAKLFREHDVDGILIAAVNFGDEQGAAWTVKKTALDVPIMLFACQEEERLTLTTRRRDSFCGLLSIGEVLRQIGAKYSVPEYSVGYPRDPRFQENLRWFGGVCRVAGALKNARYGQIGTRPDAFWTCRYDEKQLQKLGPTAVTLDLSEVLAAVGRLKDDDLAVREKLSQIKDYADVSRMNDTAMRKFAKLETFLDQWAADNRLDALAIQCWTSIEQNLGICACTSMSRLTDSGVPAACEADILGTLSMHALQLASGTPAALADWNNLHNDDPDLVNLWHCGVFPRSFAKEPPQLNVHGILPEAGACAPEEAQGVVELRVKPSPATLCRVTQDGEGGWKALVVEGDFEKNDAHTFGSYGWCRIPRLLDLYNHVLLRHFPHHVAVTQAHVAPILDEVFGNYLGMNVFHTPNS